MKRYSCQKCGKDFKSGSNPLDIRCMYCGSTKLKIQSSLPDKQYIKDFLLYRTPKCRNCGRTLKNEDSIKKGFGSTCASYFAEKWLHGNPTDLGDRAKKRWTKDEVENLIKFAQSREVIGGVK